MTPRLRDSARPPLPRVGRERPDVGRWTILVFSSGCYVQPATSPLCSFLHSLATATTQPGRQQIRENRLTHSPCLVCTPIRILFYQLSISAVQLLPCSAEYRCIANSPHRVSFVFELHHPPSLRFSPTLKQNIACPHRTAFVKKSWTTRKLRICRRFPNPPLRMLLLRIA